MQASRYMHAITYLTHHEINQFHRYSFYIEKHVPVAGHLYLTVYFRRIRDCFFDTCTQIENLQLQGY